MIVVPSPSPPSHAIMIFRWLHLSDLHQKPTEGREAQYQAILDLVRRRIDAGQPPHAVFMTGDLAWSGVAAQYSALESDFLEPLRALTGPGCPFLMVPGNHDLQRDVDRDPRPSARQPEAFTHLMQTGEAGKRARLGIVQRFNDYVAFASRHGGFGGDWLRTGEGAAYQRVPIPGHDSRQIVVVGVNTAWLCHDGEDYGRLTAGGDLVCTTLERVASNAALVVVLGHHGIEEFQRDQRRDIERAFKRHKVLYLHGHYHRNETDRFPDEVSNSYALQAGSAFQAHNNERWRNGVMLAEANLDTGSLTVEPLLYRPGDGWKFDAWDFPTPFVRGDRVVLPLPGRVLEEKRFPPPGWEVVERGSLTTLRNRTPSDQQMKRYLDGAPPDREVVVSGGLGRRKIVGELVDRLRAAGRNADRPQILLLTGAGGEGKSTAQLQVAMDLAADDWRCLIRTRSGAPLPADLGQSLAGSEQPWLIVVDEADRAVPQINAALPGLHAAGVNAHLLLAARSIDWDAAPRLEWQSHARLERLSLAGLDADDAAVIADSWRHHGEERDRQVLVAELLQHARDTDQDAGDGTLLGALLAVRFRDQLLEHVRDLLWPLKSIRAIGNENLLTCYAMIAAMHAERQTYLSHPVLAFALGCDEAELDRRVIQKLKSEALPVSEGTYVLTRHHQVAQAVLTLLRDDGQGFGVDVDALYPRLADAAIRCFLEREMDGREVENWTFKLARHFADRPATFHPLAREIAKAVATARPNHLQSFTAYAKILRLTHQASQALPLFLAKAKQWRDQPGFFYEWSMAAATARQPELSVWLAARALADNPAAKLEHKTAKLGLAGLGRACEHVPGNDEAFQRGEAACGRLGLRLAFPVDSRTVGYFHHHRNKTSKLPDMTDDEMWGALRDAAQAGADALAQRDPTLFQQLEPLLGRPRAYAFVSLARLVKPRP